MKKLLPLALCAALAAFAPAQGVYSDEDIDDSIEAGLAYLDSVQLPNGAYPGKFGDTGAISALAGMAFLAKGYTPESEKYGETIRKDIDYVLSVVNPADGYFGNKFQGQGMYVHSICTLFLSEVSGMVDPERQAKFVLLDAQNIRKNERDNGGWRYTPRSNDSDMSCSGWCLMALRSASLNGGQVPKESIEKAVEYVRKQRNPGEGSFVYQGGGNGSGRTLTGAGILYLELCGRHNDEMSLKAARYLMRVYKELPSDGNRSYGMYYAAQGLFQLGGENWKVFSDWMYRTWIPRQKSNGSWTEEESTAYSTSLLVLAFTVPYRQLPIYQRDETVDED